ncbi:glycine hydroxymethyltransferase [Pancytospora epiphaga]|nr:glycine hydroxymethyltransferase [Pancytospora epiphaga]
MLHQSIEEYDPELHQIIKDEEARQKETLNLIASENYTSISVLQANSSVLTNKYSEGKIGARYYGGNINIDRIETICKERALKLFNLDPNVWDVNVQTLSGAVANIAVYTGLVGRDGKIMGLDLPSGGHLSHGYQTKTRKISATSMFFNSKAYKCNIDGLIDYEVLEKEFKEFQPDLLICGGSAYVREFDYKKFREIAGDTLLMMDMAHVSGFIATGCMANPFEYCDIVTTTTHKILRGPRGGMIFYKKKRMYKNELFDLQGAIEGAVFPGIQGGPHNQKIAALAVALKQAATQEYKEYTEQVLRNAKAMGEEFKRMGYNLLTGGTDCHMILVSVSELGGSEADKICDLAGISINKNCVVGDKSPLSPSAIRLGTPALTTRGFKEAEFIKTVGFIDKVLKIGSEIKGKCQLENGRTDMSLYEETIKKDNRILDLKNEIAQFLSSFDSIKFDYSSK